MAIEVWSPAIRRREMNAVLSSLVDEKIGPGEQQERLTAQAHEALGFDTCLALRSPALALTLGLRAMRLPADSGVIFSALSPRYYRQAVIDLGLKPVFCDIDPETGCLASEEVRAASEAAAIQGVQVRCLVLRYHLGLMPDPAPFLELGLTVIEDCSQAYGCSLGGRPAGAFGAFTILGLEEADAITAGGGALLYAQEKRNGAVLKNWRGLPPEYGLPDMNAALALVQMREQGRNAARRAEIAELYTQQALQGRHALFIRTPDFVYNNYAFPLVLESGAKDAMAYAAKKDVTVAAAFEGTLIDSGNVSPESFPASWPLFLRTMLFPLHARLSAKDAERVGKLILTLP